MKTKLALSALAILPVLGGVASADSFGIINYEFVNIRVNPSMNDGVKFVLKKGEKVQILSEKDGWVNIKSGNKSGWVQSAAVSKEEEKTSNIKKSSKSTVMYVDNDALNLRTSPSTNSKILTVLKRGDKVTVLQESVGWSKVNFNGQEGYVSTKFLAAGNASTSSVKIVKSNTLNVRKEANVTSEKVVSLKKGDKVKFLSENSGWTKVDYNGKVGYVSSYYLEDGVDDVDDSNTDSDIEIEDTNNDDKTSIKGTVEYKDMGISLSDFADMQLSMSLNVSSLSGWSKVQKDELMKYMDPNNFTDEDGMMQFALVDRYTDDITPAQLNSYLSTVCKPGNVFYNQGAAFINAAKKNNVNVLYLVAHSMIETGNGTSKLANGVKYNGKTVYNFFGIGAVDGNALAGGAATAYKNGWTSVASGIDGAAKWISDKYIHNSQFKQNTLYGMKWSKDYIWHQYASDITWPSKIGAKMNSIARFSDKTGSISYLVPKYR